MNKLNLNLNSLLNTKKIIAGVTAGVLILGGIGSYALSIGNERDLILTKNHIDAELGQIVSTDVVDYLNYQKVSTEKAGYIVKNAKSTNNFKYATVETKDENANVVSKEEKDYPRVGEYEINFSYKEEKETVKVTVKDTTKPEITAPDVIDIIQYTDLSTFNFAQLLQVTDYSDVKDWQIDTSKVDVNTIGTYELKISISDVEKNKATKKMKINVVEAPAVAEGEVAVTEIITDENGNKKTVVTKKSSNEVSSKDNVTTGKPVDKTDKVENGSGNSSSKPSNPSGSTSGNNGNNKPTNPDKPSGGNDKPAHSHKWEAITKTVYHDAETKTVHHDAVTKTETVTVVDKEAWDEPIYEKGYCICNKCGYYTKDADMMAIHVLESCGGGWKIGSIQIGTKHHDAITHKEQKTIVIQEAWDETVVVKPAWDETVTTGYKCSCGETKKK